jgi:arsenite/tail-anchored protein-transporting ATPase
VPKLVAFLGKGGVGKTTVSSAYAVRAAAQLPNKKVLLVSTDPAHSLSDVLECRLGSSPKPIQAGARRNLFAWEINSERLFRIFLDENKDQLVEAVERGSLFTADEISSLLETALPGMAEMGALLAIHDAIDSGKYEIIVADTAPFGHTLRLFSLPEQFEKLLNFLQTAAERDQVLAKSFGGVIEARKSDFIRKWREKLQQIRDAFETARLFLVTTAEDFALNESLRCLRQLEDADPPMRLSGIVLNRIIQNPGACERCSENAKAAESTRRRLRKRYQDADLFIAVDPGFPISGVEQLKQFANAVFGGKQVRWRKPKISARSDTPRWLPAEWPNLSAPLTFVLGKGGVGKTTISAALAVHSRQTSALEVDICSVDPAPSLDDVFQVEVTDELRPVLSDPGLRASELDSLALYKAWVADLRTEIDSATSVRRSGVEVDLSYERQLFSELLEMVPPGLDEVLAIFRIMELSQRRLQRVIIDMAPTGHALELLRTPERILVWSRLLLKSLASHRKLALAREAAVKVAELEVRARELARAFQSAQVGCYVVMLPEPLPDRETERLLLELRELGIKPAAAFVNRVLMPVAPSRGSRQTRLSRGALAALPVVGRSGKEPDRCAFCHNVAGGQTQVLSGLKKKLGVGSVYVISALSHGPAGKRGLLQVTRNLWQLT